MPSPSTLKKNPCLASMLATWMASAAEEGGKREKEERGDWGREERGKGREGRERRLGERRAGKRKRGRKEKERERRKKEETVDIASQALY